MEDTSPDTAWHYDLTLKVVNIFRGYGYTTEQLYGGCGFGSPAQDAFRILGGEHDGDRLPQYKHRIRR